MKEKCLACKALKWQTEAVLCYTWSESFSVPKYSYWTHISKYVFLQIGMHLANGYGENENASYSLLYLLT